MISALRFQNKPNAVAVTASTGAAATLLSGTTIHSFSGCGLAKERCNLCKKDTQNQCSLNGDI